MKKSKADNQQVRSKAAIISDSVGNYEKHPFFVRRRNEAKAFLKKVGLPAELTVKTTK
jgi:hypothetical protein